jgi:hypothetical protein
MTGILLQKYQITNDKSFSIDLSGYQGQVLLIKAGEMIRKVVVLAN